MAQGLVTFMGGALLAGALLGASTPPSRALQACQNVPAAQREQARLAGRCEGRAPIVNVAPQDLRRAAPVRAARSPVPDLRGRPFNRSDERLARFIVAIDYRPSAQRRDWVLDQVPRAPASLPAGGDLRLVLSDGALVFVPDVRGSYARALAALYRAGLAWSATEGPAAGRVIGQAPAPGTEVRPGTQIALRVAPGAAAPTRVPGPIALAPESTRPDVAPPPPASAAPSLPSTVPSAAPPAARPPVSAPPPLSVPAPATPQAASGPSTPMPDVQGMIFDAARERLAGANVSRLHRAGTEPGGTVIGQTPAPGAALSPGTPVRLVLSDGSLVRVPRALNFTLNEARQRLASGELKPVITTVPGDAPAGTVVSQQPAEGQIARRGSAVRLGISAGPVARPTLAVPNLVGIPLNRAQTQLARFKVELSERGAREPAGVILEQSPAAGQVVEPGSTVSITVSSGGRPEVFELQNVVGQSADAATASLSEFRLERQTVPSTAPAGQVLAQEPQAGAGAAPGSTVQLRVSDGSLVRVPPLANSTLVKARETAQALGLRLALSEGPDVAGAAILRQEPAAGAEVGRGSELRVAVEDRSTLLDRLPAPGAVWSRTTAAGRTPLVLAVLLGLLLALLALAVLLRRRRAPSDAPLVRTAVAARPRTPPSVRRTEPLPITRVPPDDSVRAPPVGGTPDPVAATAQPPTPERAAPPQMPAAVRVAPPPKSEPEPVAFAATARLESDPAATSAAAALPRGPEIQLSARLEAGAVAAREVRGQDQRDELTEETK